MTTKESIPRVLIILGIGLLIAIAGCIGQSGNDGSPTPTATEIANTTTTTATTVNSSTGTTASTNTTVSAAPAPPQTIKCEICHTNPQNLTPHVNGGKLCINCHGSQVHNIHIGEGTVNLDCKTCHGFPPKIPTVAKGSGPGTYSVCEQCHAPPPNNTQPSYGNLIVIHLSRGKYCTNCHGTDIGQIHATVLARLNNESNAPVGNSAITGPMETVGKNTTG